ncbi:MAG: helix-turn-helix domain-containing protein [Pyrinomonadaceae bacterium]|nr:helix-turn-helix domain-containing protein [Pyrinomonadaceae bacterium]
MALPRVYELARERAIPSVRVGDRQIRFEEDALREWVASGGNVQTGNVSHTPLASGGGV